MVMSAFRLIWDRNALDDFKAILDFLKTQSDEAPKIVKKAMLSELDRIRLNPLLSEPDKLKLPADEAYRAFTVFSYRVTYFINAKSNEIWILRIRHTSREPFGY